MKTTRRVTGVLLVGFCLLFSSSTVAARRLPNLIFILADDFGYGDLGCYGQKLIQTPRLDQMAREGMRFRQFYAGSTVCAPSRSVLMTGRHLGHTHVRGNARDRRLQALPDSDVTLAELLKKADYRTALCGKWGLGEDLPGARTGLPLNQGFDYFYGYLNQRHAHNYYPAFLWRNQSKVLLRNTVVEVESRSGGFPGGYATKRVDYSHDLIAQEARDFVVRNQDKPFFLYLALTIPHANNEGTRATGHGQEVPDYGIYRDKPWSDQDKGQAAMISRMDRDLGRLLDKLAELEIDQDTVVMFSSDNGHHDEGGNSPETFDPNGPLRGMKRDLYEGGIRVPMIVRWPGKTPAGSVSDHIGYFGDLIAMAADLAGVDLPGNLDSISLLPTITGQPEQQRKHDYLYWEFYERGGKQALRQGRWKAIRMPIFSGRTQLYDLSRDLGEANDISDEQPRVVEALQLLMDAAHTPHPGWTPQGEAKQDQPPPGDGRLRF